MNKPTHWMSLPAPFLHCVTLGSEATIRANLTKDNEMTLPYSESTSEVIAVKERPILFSAPMVRAILEGRKNMGVKNG